VWNDNHAVYGDNKVWRQLGRENINDLYKTEVI
jgi:hypothetical protein